MSTACSVAEIRGAQKSVTSILNLTGRTWSSAHAKAHGGGEELTYGQLGADARLLAAWLGRCGAAPRRVVGGLMEHRYEYLLGQLGAGVCGAAYFPMETHFGPQMLSELLGATCPVALLASASYG